MRKLVSVLMIIMIAALSCSAAFALPEDNGSDTPRITETETVTETGTQSDTENNETGVDDEEQKEQQADNDGDQSEDQEEMPPEGDEQEESFERDLRWYITQPEYTGGAEEEPAEDPLGETEQFLVTITNPKPDEKDIIYFSGAYTIFGIVKEPRVRVTAAVYNGFCYDELVFTGEETGIPVNSLGLFGQEIKLKEGRNRIKIVAYTDEAVSSAVPGENLQITYFTITRKPNLKEQLFNIDRKVMDVFHQIWQSLGGK